MSYNPKSLNNLKPGKGRKPGSANNASKRVAELLRDAAAIDIDLFRVKMHQLSDRDFCTNYLHLLTLYLKEEKRELPVSELFKVDWTIIPASQAEQNKMKE